MKTSDNKHLIDLILNSPRVKLGQSENIILENRDTKESIVDFVRALKQKNTDFADIYVTILEANQIPPKLVINENAKAKRKTEKLALLSKSENLSLNRLYSRGRAAYGSVRKLCKASGLSKKNVKHFLPTNTSYTKFSPPIRRFRRLRVFQNI